MVERRKTNQLAERSVNAYFWRTYDQKEIDYIEEHAGRLCAYEFKWGAKSEMKKSTRRTFLEAYPNAQVDTITQKNFESLLSP
jgi:uncharacterized protein